MPQRIHFLSKSPANCGRENPYVSIFASNWEMRISTLLVWETDVTGVQPRTGDWIQGDDVSSSSIR